MTCPKCQHQRQPTDATVHPDICPACGISYSKWRAKHQDVLPQKAPVEATASQITYHNDTDETFRQWVFNAFNYVHTPIEPVAFWGRACLAVALSLWGIYFMQAGVDWQVVGSSFMHNINLPFHEFGHVFFAPFGTFLSIAGGSLFQLLLPLGLMLGFVFHQRDTFAASVTLWWCGQSFVDLAPYIADAKYRTLPLVGGRGEESHDWGNLLTMLSLVEHAPGIATSCFAIGSILMITAMLWAASLLKKQYTILRAS